MEKHQKFEQHYVLDSHICESGGPLCLKLGGRVGFRRLVAEINWPLMAHAPVDVVIKKNREGSNMRWRLGMALAVLAVATAPSMALAQMPPQCTAFGQLRTDTEQKATAVRAAVAKKVDRKEICALMQRFYAAEEAMVKFLEDNKTWCGIPDQAVQGAKAGHERSLKFRTAACTDAPEAKPRAPSLSDAIGTPSVDTGSNTKTGRGTLDSLNGNPLAR